MLIYKSLFNLCDMDGFSALTAFKCYVMLLNGLMYDNMNVRIHYFIYLLHLVFFFTTEPRMCVCSEFRCIYCVKHQQCVFSAFKMY